YANANGALWAQAAATSVLLAVSRLSKMARAASSVAGLLFAGLTLVSGSLAATALLSLVVVAAIAGSNERARKWFVLGVAALAGMALWTSIVLGAGYRFEFERPPSQELAEESLSTRRLVLWRDASDLIGRHPLTGVGPRRFGVESPIALADSDTTETHNEFLQQGAETGVVGLALMILLFGWTFVRIVRTPGAPSAIAGAAVAMLAIHSTVDYILHFPIVPIVAAALVGASPNMRKTRPPEGDRALS
ncbi:MAG: O-antigen ligase family protein, partial [Actinomycetota bacterium]